ncbi:hypothetical protein [Pseudoxanthomonas sp. Root65]|uniref:hypothetical protein n=1 Tax=Pseudoxanthomonas sp. Root65 TaxID=1736576 RepID=UPI0012E3B5A6|nr:hypothetical protein [Pseudoxanthomonas sp. Root65]
MSKQKGLPDSALADRVVAGVRAIAMQWPFVTSASDHFAGYFNELGITLTIASDARDDDVLSLQNMLLAYLDSFWAKENPDFTWVVMFSDETKAIVPLVLGDGPRSGSEDLRA